MIGLLIVDDEEVTRRGLARSIDWGSAGIGLVAVASDGLQALEQLERHHPAVVILDVHMPEMDGLAVLSIIRSRYPHTRTILISGYEDFADAQRAVNLSAFAFLSKPMDQALLLQTVRQAVEAIRREQSEVRGSEELRREFDRLVPELRVSFLCRLMSPAPGEEREAVAQAGFLGLRLPPSFPACLQASVAVLEPSSPEPAPGVAESARSDADGFARFALARRAEAELLEGTGGFAFPFGDCVCLVVFHEPGDRGRVRDRCRALIDWAASALGCAVTAGIGAATDRLTGLCASYESARQALEYRFMLGRAEAIDFEQVRDLAAAGSPGGPSLAELRLASARIARALREKSAEGAKEIAQGLFGELVRRFSGQVAPRPTLAFLLSFVLVDAQIAVGIRQEGDPAAELSSCRTVEEIGARTDRILEGLVRRVEDSGRRRDDVIAGKARQYMLEHVFQDISLTAVADALRIHPNYLSRVFHASVGRTFIEYEIGMKMDAARKLLTEENRKVYEVAALLQYRDVNHFTRVFKKHVGISPSEYRGTS